LEASGLEVNYLLRMTPLTFE